MAVPAAVVQLRAAPISPTLQSHLLAAERAARSDAGKSLSWIVSAISSACKTIAARLRTAGIDGNLGAVGNMNVQGESQQALDVIANELLIRELQSREGVAVLGSEENDELLVVDDAQASGVRYSVLFDPLDGSSNLDVGGSVGTIFSIYEVPPGTELELQAGRRQVAAGYVLYGPSTVFVMTMGQGVDMFVLDPSVGTFVRTASNLQIPARGKSYSVNEANFDSFPVGYQRFIADCRKAGYASRYAGAMVADVHRVLLQGGVFLYPPTAKAPKGKLRLMYEANPMAWLLEQAGGMGSTGEFDILDVVPDSLHQRVPVILGSPEDVKALRALL
ncbi:MAG: class 1 fructose-bisphosphatase [Gammaproteobacteria bacterium]|nr:class 1 fructose-bisphosphatase [Gammaproteobacteria bacterium]